ncbi:MAG TPA: formimidoylglutamate deiminase [Opitutaceae bacterium]
MADSRTTAWLPDAMLVEGRFERGLALVADARGRIERLARDDADLAAATRLPGRAMLPGMVNAHSHTFQRVIRGRTEHRTGPNRDTFWTWREKMFHAATALDPDDIYDAARMAFLEMALSGITTVGEFHYLHHAPGGVPYADPNETAKRIVQAARDTGIRIALLHCAYVRAGPGKEPTPAQIRFSTPSPVAFLDALSALGSDLAAAHARDTAWTGIAPHSVRAVPLDYLRALRDGIAGRPMPVHMHVSEQPAENEACLAEHGVTPSALLEREGILGRNFTAVHAIHMTPQEFARFARAGVRVCACPTTERNLGDGTLRADLFLGRPGMPGISLGTDSNMQIDLLEDARQIEYHLRLHQLERQVLEPQSDDGDSDPSALARLLFTCASRSGADALHAPGGSLEPGRAADFFTVDLNDPSIAGTDPADVALLTNIVFCAGRPAIRDVVVGGRAIVRDSRHADQDAVIARFKRLQSRLWS